MTIDEAQWEQVNTSSFSSVKQTAIHIASAESIWNDFWTGKEDPIYLSVNFNGTKNDLVDIWLKASEAIHALASNLPGENFDRPVTFTYPDGRSAQLPYYQSLAHCINHSTYHRGQLVTLLRQVAFKQFTSIDLATYYLTK